jgi:outer membrane protein assembly factor BamB
LVPNGSQENGQLNGHRDIDARTAPFIPGNYLFAIFQWLAERNTGRCHEAAGENPEDCPKCNFAARIFDHLLSPNGSECPTPMLVASNAIGQWIDSTLERRSNNTEGVSHMDAAAHESLTNRCAEFVETVFRSLHIINRGFGIRLIRREEPHFMRSSFSFRRRPIFCSIPIILCCVLPSPVLGADATRASSNWPQWRGPLGTGVSPDGDPPVEFSETKNMRWKVAIPGKGHSTPIVWGDRVYLTTAVPIGEPLEKPRFSGRVGAHDNLPITHRHKFVALALSRRDGKILWQKTLSDGLPLEGGHNTASLASASPVTDGERVFAFFGSQGLFCLDMDGNLKWKVDLGDMHTKHGHGEGSTPVLFGETLVVNWDHEGQSFVVAFDKRTGKQRWRSSRDEVTSWATPIVVQVQGKPQVVISGTDRVRSYDLASGKIVWQCGGLAHNIVASPVAGNGMVFVGSSYEKRALLAIRLKGSQGDITGTDRVAWRRTRGTPYVPSPLLYGDSLYFLTHYQGIITRVRAKTGEDAPGAFRLGVARNIYASPVAAANRVYVTDSDGMTLVLSHHEKPKILAVNRLHDRFSASAAIADRELFLRGEKHLYCLASE